MSFDDSTLRSSFSKSENSNHKENQSKDQILEKFDFDEDFRDQCFDVWFGKDFFATKITGPETEKEYLVLNLEKLADRYTEKFEKSGCVIPKFKVLLQMQKKLNDELFLSLDQIDSEDFAPKKLLYWPENLEEVSNEMEIKNSSFHFLPSDIVQKNTLGTVDMLEKNGDTASVSLIEAEFAAVLFHPDYGNGFRDRSGNLAILNKNTGKYEKLAYKHLEALGFGSKMFKQETSGGRESRSIMEGMHERLPHLFAEGLLKEGDIQQTMRRTADAAGNMERAELHIKKKPIGVGNAVYNGVVHHIGRKYNPGERPGVEVLNLNKDIALILDEDGVVEAYFNLFEQEDPEVIKGGGGNRQTT